MSPSSELLGRWGLKGKKVFLYVGTHAFYHGLDTLVEAAALLKHRQDLAFLFIGDGPERPRLERMCNEKNLQNVIFGKSPYDEMDRLYSIAYASIATLRKMQVAKEMRLSKVFPSLSCGVPVIYAGEGEAAELLRSNECGICVPPEDPVLLKEAIERLADRPALRDTMGHRGRALVERDYSWSCIIRRWLDEIRNVTSRAATAT